jgi:hypothetical protein
MASSCVDEIGRTYAAQRQLVARSLSGYLCGTHSGGLARRRADRLAPDQLGAVHRNQQESLASREELIWEARWEPRGELVTLAGRLSAALDHPAVVDLLVYGSQAGGATTGFSDFDAVLVIADETVEDAAALAALRSRVLAAQRAVLAYQPMQHHGFEVATPKLLESADATLELPREALLGAQSLCGRRLAGGCSGVGLDPATRLRSMAAQLSRLSDWPRHPWRLHAAVSMFELLPALHVQASGRAVSKAESFAVAREQFEGDWWPYDVLRDVREAWPRRPHRRLEVAAAAARNPWVAVDTWTRLPSRWPAVVRALLSASCLEALQEIARRMAGSAR